MNFKQNNLRKAMTYKSIFPVPAKEILNRYKKAQAMMQGTLKFGTGNIVPNALLFPVWIEGTNCFWYEQQLKGGTIFRLVNADAGSNEPAFDHNALAEALSQAVGEQVDAVNLPINFRNIISPVDMTISLEPLTLSFTAFNKRWKFIDESASLTLIEQIPRNWLISPDGRHAAFSRDYNIWVKDLHTHQERALTIDGEQYYQYAIPGSVHGNDGMTSILGLQAQWSPDSKRLFTVQLDQRQVKTVGVVHHVPSDGSLRPQTTFHKLAFPGDEQIEAYRLLSIEVETGSVQGADYARVPATYGGSGGFFENAFGWWNIDSRHAYFIDVDRYYKYARVVTFDTLTGATKTLFEERSVTRVSLSSGPFDLVGFTPLPETHEIVWYSDRSGWPHLYLYDLVTGQLKHAITSGKWAVRDIIFFDAKRRELFITTSGRVDNSQQSKDPYYRDLVRVNIDTGQIATLVSSDDEYITVSPRDIMQTLNGYAGVSSGVSPLGDYAVTTRSRADKIPKSYLISRNGEKILDLETADISGLPESWRWPEPVKMKAADGKTDIYGVIYRPSDFSADKSYPVIDQSFIAYPYPIAAKGAFENNMALGSAYFEAASLAELGFIVVQIDGRGSRFRGKKFWDESYGWMSASSNIDDHVSGIKQLAERFPYMDLERVGISGLNMGGNGVLEGLLKHPDFYKVGTVGQLYDARIMGANWGDFNEGIDINPDEKHPEDLVSNLRGKLLLMVGLEDYVPAAATFRLVAALYKSNKDFDLIVDPNWGYSANQYQIRRAWDYLVRHLMGEQPPEEFNLAGTI